MKTPLELTEYFLDPDLKWITSGDDTQYCFTKEGNENILLFAESNSKVDWKNNFTFFRKPYRHMETTFYVHGGFLKCWKLIHNDILEYVSNCKMDNLTIAGWSYGGALATLCTEDLWFNNPMLKTRTVTFGSPKVLSIFGFRKAQERFNNMFMFKNGADIITTLPFSIMGFKHVTNLTKIGERPKLFNYFKPRVYHNMIYKTVYGYVPILQSLLKDEEI